MTNVHLSIQHNIATTSMYVPVLYFVLATHQRGRGKYLMAQYLCSTNAYCCTVVSAKQQGKAVDHCRNSVRCPQQVVGCYGLWLLTAGSMQ